MQFAYQVIDQSGARQSGTIEAGSSLAAGHALKEQGFIPVMVREVSAGGQKDFFSGFQRIKIRDKLVFVQDLGVMLKAGIPLSRGLQVLSKQSNNAAFTKVLHDVSRSVENGKSLNESLAKHPKVFSEIFVSMIRVGEMSGSLDQALEYLKVQLEREAELTGRVRGAMIYPSVVLVVMILAAVVMGTFVLPKLTSIFKDFDASLPFATRVLVAASDFLSKQPVLVFSGLIALGFGVFRGLKVSAVRNIIFLVALRLPGLGNLVREVSLARFSRIAASLLKSGISMVEMLQVTGEAMPNPFYRKAAIQASEAVQLGKPMTESLAQNPRLFPFIVTQMLQVGEETGSVEVILEQLASHYEASVDASLKNLSSIIEPVLLVVIGTVVGIVAYALIIPIYNIGNQID